MFMASYLGQTATEQPLAPTDGRAPTGTTVTAEQAARAKALLSRWATGGTYTQRQTVLDTSKRVPVSSVVPPGGSGAAATQPWYKDWKVIVPVAGVGLVALWWIFK